MMRRKGGSLFVGPLRLFMATKIDEVNLVPCKLTKAEKA